MIGKSKTPLLRATSVAGVQLQLPTFIDTAMRQLLQLPHLHRSKINEHVVSMQERLRRQSNNDEGEGEGDGERVGDDDSSSASFYSTTTAAVAYTLGRMGGTYAANVRVQSEVSKVLPSFAPRRILDYGAGGGSASLAAAAIFGPRSAPRPLEFTIIEASKQMQMVNEVMIECAKRECGEENGDGGGGGGDDDNDDAVAAAAAAAAVAADDDVDERHLLAHSPRHISRALYEFNTYSTLPGANRQVMEGKVNVDAYELVLASYVVGEATTAAKRRRLARALWSRTACDGVFIVIEPGTPSGFQTISDIRHDLLTIEGEEEASPTNDFIADVVAPCPHARRCPMTLENNHSIDQSNSKSPQTWCHFQQRYLRLPTMHKAKGGGARNHQDERYSFLVLRKRRTQSQHANSSLSPYSTSSSSTSYDHSRSLVASSARLVARPLRRSRHVLLDACDVNGELRRLVVAKSAGSGAFKSARKARWGDLFRT